MTQNTTQSYRFPGSPIAPANVSDWDVRHCRLHDDARRFQGGIPNLVGIVGALAGIVFFQTAEHTKLYAQLKKSGVYCGRFLGGICIDPTFYNRFEEIDRFLAVVRSHVAANPN